MGKKLTAKKRSTGQGFRNPSPAFSDFKRGLTGYEGSLPPRYLGCRPAVPGPSASSTPRLLFRRGLPLRVSAFLARRAAACSCPPSTPCPGRRLDKAVLLTSFFTSVRSSSVRDGAVGSMAEEGVSASSGSGSSCSTARPGWGLRPPG